MTSLRPILLSSLVALAVASLGVPGCSLRYDVDELRADELVDSRVGAVSDGAPPDGDGSPSDGGDQGGDGDAGDLPDASPHQDAPPGHDAAPDCGGSGEVCCEEGDACQDGFEECRDGSCQACGGTLQSCCDPGGRCAGVLNCLAGLCVL